jgi:hypothetical protein
MGACTICGEDSECAVCSLVRVAGRSGLGMDDLDVVIIPAMVQASSGHLHLCGGHKSMFEDAHRAMGAKSSVFVRPAIGEVS